MATSKTVRYCLLCKKYDTRRSRTTFTTIYSAERADRLRKAYQRLHNGEELEPISLNQVVHKKCYNKTVECLPLTNETSDPLGSIQQNPDEHDDEFEQTSLIQSRLRVSIPYDIKHQMERHKRTCFVCQAYHYSSQNPMKQILTNFTADKLAKGYFYRYKQAYGKPLLDAYIHKDCYKKLYSSYRNRMLSEYRRENNLPYRIPNIIPIVLSPHHTRSKSNIDKSKIISDDSDEMTIDELFSHPLSTNNSETELSARLDLFRPCLKQLTQEEIDFYTKRNPVPVENHEDVPVTSSEDSNPLPAISLSVLEASTRDQTLTDTNVQPIKRIYPAAEIRYLSSKSAQPNSTDHDYISHTSHPKHVKSFDLLYDWLIDHLKTSEYPISMHEVLKQYKKICGEDFNPNTSERTYRTRIRTYFEKLYPNEFVFCMPSKRDGTYIALNDIKYYLGFSIKNSQDEKERTTETSIISTVINPPTAKDTERETCEIVMNAIRKIRLYIRDSKQINSQPSIFMQNLIGMITTSDRQFDKISHDYQFYQMIEQNLFDSNEQNTAKRYDKTIRNMSLASDLISARHDHQISQKHYLLAEEISKESFHCTPRQVITLLNRYGHTCSYSSYQRMKAAVQRTTDELLQSLMDNAEKSSNSELDLMEL